MSNYNIAQVRYSKGTEYLKSEINKKFTSNDLEYDVNSTMGTKDLKITFSFAGLTTYYLSCALIGFGYNTPTSITVKLVTEDTVDNKREQVVKTYTDLKSSFYNIEFAFTPKTAFSKIVFELHRTTKDDFSGSPRVLVFRESQNVVLSSVNNILAQNNVDSAFKLGIQGSPSLITCINGEPIRLGQSGVFEIYREDFDIYSVGFIIKPEDENKNFIMDYCYY